MSGTVHFKGAFPIGDTDVANLPVKHLGPAIGYYTLVLGFVLVSREEGRAVLQRDEARIGLAENGQDPEQASCYFAVSDVEGLRRELEAKGIEPTAIRVDQHEGKQYRVCFAREPYGVCFCFGQQI
ncbi:MAG: VOC family protein [Candidatus Latescibacteria bacterium]|nr:VOC family protein [Candidatus Latescibacterota bacterium]